MWSGAMSASDLKDIIDWLIDCARSSASPTQMFAETCERLLLTGLPLWRVGLFVRTLHPDIIGRNYIWRRGTEVVAGTADHHIQDSPEFKNSPLAIVFGEGREVRYRLDDPQSLLPVF
jgi:adenylate cyclase